ADRPALDHERNAEQRLDPLLAQDRVEDVRMVDLVQDERLEARGYPLREATPDGDPHALFDLSLEADRGARDELLGLVVDEEDRCGVDAQLLARAREQRRQQFVQPQVCERRISYALETPQVVGRNGGDRRFSVLPLQQAPRWRRTCCTRKRRGS